MKEVGFDLRDAPHSWVPQDDRLRHGDGRAIHRQYKPRKRLRYLTWPFVIAQMFLAEALLSRGAEAEEIDTSESGDHDGSAESAHMYPKNGSDVAACGISPIGWPSRASRRVRPHTPVTGEGAEASLGDGCSELAGKAARAVGG